MIPAIAGNTVGGLITGFLIKRYGRIKGLIIVSAVFSLTCYVLLYFFWNGTGISGWMCLMTFPGGLAVGIAHSALFVALAASIGEDNMAIAGSGQYLCGTVGSVAGICAASAVFQGSLRATLSEALDDPAIPGGDKVCYPLQITESS